ncbi:hypothetical protein [Castellaniella sp.]|uniref:hypothetical protein n=1 Tax=Castellaniella sp. TaxID=1955812 RepID=UPI003C7366E0
MIYPDPAAARFLAVAPNPEKPVLVPFWHRLFGGTSGRLAALSAAVVLAGCSFTGNGLHTAGLDHIVVGRTTLAQASESLGAQPTDVWQQGNSTLVRWANKVTVATDAFYVRQEVWLRFGSDGTFERMEKSINVPVLRHPKTAAQADQEAAQKKPAIHQALAAEGQARPAEDMIFIPGNGEPVTGPVPVVPPAKIVPVAPVAPSAKGASLGLAPAHTLATTEISATQPLLPAGSRITPVATYPLPGQH